MKRLFKLALFGGLIYGVVRFVQAQKAEWEGLSETELRDKIDTKLGGRVPDEAAEQIKEGVVHQMQSMGKLREEDTSEESTEEPSGDADADSATESS